MKLILVPLLVTSSILAGCRQEAEQLKDEPKVVFDVEGDPEFFATIEHPVGPSSIDNKLHYKITIRRTPLVSSDPALRNGTELTPVLGHEKGKRPKESMVAEYKPIRKKQWSEVYGTFPETNAQIIDVALNPDQSKQPISLEGSCSIKPEISCWTPDGKVNEPLTNQTKFWYEKQLTLENSRGENNKILIFKHNRKSLSYSERLNEVGLDMNGMCRGNDGNYNYVAFKVDPSIDRMPYKIVIYELTGEKTKWFKVPSMGETVQVDKMSIKRIQSKSISSNPSWRTLNLEITPYQSRLTAMFPSVKSTDNGPVERRWGRFTENGYELNLEGLEELNWLQFEYNREVTVLWKNIPLSPKDK